MPPRHDTLPAPKKPVGIRIDIESETRDQFRTIAASLGYTMSALARLLIEKACEDPEKNLKKIPKNPR